MSKNLNLKLIVFFMLIISCNIFAEIAAAHVYHNHMPNFWPYYDVSKYDTTPVGGPVRYTYDGQVIKKKREGMALVAAGKTVAQAKVEAAWPYWVPTTMPGVDGTMVPFGAGNSNSPEKYYNTPMPHDDLGNDGIGPYGSGYYVHPDKRDVYNRRPPDLATRLNGIHPKAQMHITMSGALLNNIQSIRDEGVLPAYYPKGMDWFAPWKTADSSLKTTNGYKAFDMVHFTGHHTMGPLVGNDVFLKELIYHNTVLAQPGFFGDQFKSSKGFFPTELGFSERLIPVLAKIGVEWSFVGSTHFARTLDDYPEKVRNEVGLDLNTSPPNRADAQTTDPFGGTWVEREMKNSSGGYQLDGTVRPNMMTHVKYPYSSVPGWIRAVNPETGAEDRIAAMPVDESASWLEGFVGSVVPDVQAKYESLATDKGRKVFFGIAHDGDNNRGASGGYGTWANAADVTYKYTGTVGMGIDEYLKNAPIPSDYVIHVQDGSWADTMDSSADPTWNHWRIPMGIWNGNPNDGASYAKGSGQWTDFRKITGLNYGPKKSLRDQYDQYTVSFEYGYNYLERNYALLQAALNYAKTAEQIWLDTHPNYWAPLTKLDLEIVGKKNLGNQLNPWMYSYPVKGDAANDYKGGANPAELAWYFLIPSIDSGFGYYDENIDDGAKPTISFNQSLYFSEPYVTKNIAKDKTGPSIWWPQRFPYNPGSSNCNKQDGWKAHYYNNVFGIYTYAYDVSGIKSIKAKVRVHRDKKMTPIENACKVYDPAAAAAKGVPNVDVNSVGAWVEYPMSSRDLTPDINGVKWQPSTMGLFGEVPAKKIGSVCYAYIKDYRDQLLDYYIEAEDNKGNITKSEIQQVYVGIGKYRKDGTYRFIEDINGAYEGTHPFVTDTPPPLPSRASTIYVESTAAANVVLQYKTVENSWSTNVVTTAMTAPNEKYKMASFEFKSNTDQVNVRYSIDNGATWLPSSSGVAITSGTFTIYANGTSQAGAPAGITNSLTLYYKGTRTYVHWRPEAGTWTAAPGILMPDSEVAGMKKITLSLGLAANAEVCFNTNNSNWDSNGGKNYLIPAGTYLFDESATEKISSYTPGIIVTDKLLGDFDLDGTVGLKDFIEFSKNYGTSNTQYDIAPAVMGTGIWAGTYSRANPDSKVDIRDFGVITNNYGRIGTAFAVKRVGTAFAVKRVLVNSHKMKGDKKILLSDISVIKNGEFTLKISGKNFLETTDGMEITLKYNPAEIELVQNSLKALDNVKQGGHFIFLKERIRGEITVVLAVPKGNLNLNGNIIGLNFKAKNKSSTITIESSEINGISDYSISDIGMVKIRTNFYKR